MTTSPSVRGVAGGAVTSGNYVLPRYLGTLAGDLMLAWIVNGGSVAPPGWLLIDDFLGLKTYKKIAGVGEPASYNFGGNGGGGIIISARDAIDVATIGTRAQQGSGTAVTAPSINIAKENALLVHAGFFVAASNESFIAPPADMTEVYDQAFPIAGQSFMFGVFEQQSAPGGATGAKTATASSSLGWQAQMFEFYGPVDHELAGVVTGVASVAGIVNVGFALAGVAAGSADIDALLNLDFELEGVAAGHADISGLLAGTPSLDFTKYDAYIDLPGLAQGLFFETSQQPQTKATALRSVRQDVGNNPDEVRPDFGDIFAQSDFSHGMGQSFYHQPGRDVKRFYWQEGFDISDPGILRHLRVIAKASTVSTAVGKIVQAGGLPFVVDAQAVLKGNGAFPGTWTSEDPSGAAEAAADVLDLTSGGAKLYAALGAAGVHVRSSAGTWTHLQPDGATDLDINPARVVAWVKDRLMVASDDELFEVVADSTPTAIETYAEGWSPVSIFEAGGFIHVCVVNVDAGVSRIHHYGLNDTADAIEKKSSTPWPIGQLVYVGKGYLGVAIVGGGKVNSSGGYDPFLYRCEINPQTGELDFTLIRQEMGSSSADLSVRAIEAIGNSVLCSWSLGAGAYGGARDGIAIYDLARDAFSHHLKLTGVGNAHRVPSILPYKGRILFAISSDGLYYEDLTTYTTTAQLVTSLADWNNAGFKVWDEIEVSHNELPASTKVVAEYAIEVILDASWRLALTSEVDDADGAVVSISNTFGRRFALRVTSTATASAAPEFTGYSVRSNPAPERQAWDLTRFVRLLSRDQKDIKGPVVLQDPRAIFRSLQDVMQRWVTFYESGFVYRALVVDVATVEQEQPYYVSRAGESLKDAFVVRISMTGIRS